MLKMKKLKKCPFCKGEARLDNQVERIGHGESVAFYYVRCVECGARGRRCSDRDYGVCDIVMAVDFWNKRKLFNFRPVIYCKPQGTGKTLSLIQKLELESKNKTQ